MERRSSTLDSEAGLHWSKFEVSSSFPKVAEEIQVFWDVCMRQTFALTFVLFPFLSEEASVRMP